MLSEIEADRKLKEELEQLRSQAPKPGSPEMEAILAAGYPDIQTREHAMELIERRKKNPADIPWELNQRALAFLEALDAKPKKEKSPGRPASRE